MHANWFDSDRHRPFDEGSGERSALLIHGFMGTPAEMRPLAKSLRSIGYRSVGPLLPGFGERISELPEVGRSDWLSEASSQWDAVHGNGAPSVLIGFSMGGAIAIHLAHRRPPDRLILVAPLWKLLGGDPKLRLLPLVKRFVSSVKPFAGADLSDPEIRRFFNEAMPDLDLDDPVVQQHLRTEVELPTSTLDELRQMADQSGELIADITVPTLILQGVNDQSVRASDTRELSRRMGRNVRLVELPGDHMLVSSEKETWQFVQETVIDFVRGDD